MCGIVGAVSADGTQTIIPPDRGSFRENCEQIVKRTRHRGPDEHGLLLSEKGLWWLGHNRLSIVSPEHGRQPIANKTNTSFVVANGEIYNHLELRKELGLSAADLTTDSDSEIVMHMYEKYGLDMCDKFLGMFAFLFVKEDGTAVACRDKVGIKPLYMGTSHDKSTVYFASELKSIVDQCSPEDMMEFPAGHYWTRQTGLVKYYQPAWDVDGYSQSLRQAAGFTTAEQCKAALEEAVIKRCMADVEVGLLLSGGLDSTIIGAIMHLPHVRKHLTQTHGKIKSFAVGQEGSPDIVAARIVSEFLGTEHIEALFTPEQAFDVLDKIIYHCETYEPELIRSCIPNYFLAKKTSEYVKVVMTGEGSDELWSGYLYFRDCHDADALQEENRRILKSVQFVNLKRADRMTMAHSLEARVPFFDVNNLQTAMSADPAQKLITAERNMSEKWMLRKMYEDIIPAEVCWRTKAMQCEGVGMTWVQTIQEHCASLVSDEEFAAAATTFPSNTPHSKEEYYYRKIFEQHYPGCDKFTHVWAGGCRAGGASFESSEYTRAGLVNTELLKKGHGGAADITV